MAINPNYGVPDFEIYDDELIPSFATQARPKNSAVGDEEVTTELVWQNGQVVLQSQNLRSQRRAEFEDVVELPPPGQIQIPPEGDLSMNFFMDEDEMLNLLHHPLVDSTPFARELYADLLYPTTRLAPITDDVLNEPQAPALVDLVREFSPFSGHNGWLEHGGPSTEPTVVDSSDTPALRGPPKAILEPNFNNTPMHVSAGTLGPMIREIPEIPAGGGGTDVLMNDFSGDSGASVEPKTPKPAPPPVIEDRKWKGKGKGREVAHNPSGRGKQVVDVEYSDVKKRVNGSTSTKRSRAAEVHNQSERRRRDKINEKMKILQALIPRCNKTDKASMLDDAIEYLKSLQMQIRMMSLGCSMFPMMFPAVQRYMQSVGMGMGMDMEMIRSMMQFPPLLPGPGDPNQTGTDMAPPRFPIPNFHLPSNPNRVQATNLQVPNPMMNPSSQNLTHPQMLQQQNIVDLYQQYLLMQQSRASALSQNPRLMNQPNTNNPEGNDNGNLQ